MIVVLCMIHRGDAELHYSPRLAWCYVVTIIDSPYQCASFNNTHMLTTNMIDSMINTIFNGSSQLFIIHKISSRQAMLSQFIGSINTSRTKSQTYTENHFPLRLRSRCSNTVLSKTMIDILNGV